MLTEIQSLRNVLADLYSQKASIRRVTEDANLDLARIDLDAASIDIWHSVLAEAEKVGRIELLILTVEREYSSNHGWRSACNAYRRATGQLVENKTPSYFIEAVRQGGEPLMNCIHEMDAFHELLDNASTAQRAILLQGDSGCGKTRLLTEYQRLAERRDYKVVHFDLGRLLSVEQCLTRLMNNCAEPARFTDLTKSLRKKMPDSLSRQADWHLELTRAFFNDLRAQRAENPLFVFFDHVEKADRPLRSWLLEHFVSRLEGRPLRVVLAGRSELERAYYEGWVRFFTPKIPQIEHFYEYARLYAVQFEPEDMNALFTAFQATPKGFVDYVNAKHLQQRGQPR